VPVNLTKPYDRERIHIFRRNHEVVPTGSRQDRSRIQAKAAGTNYTGACRFCFELSLQATEFMSGRCRTVAVMNRGSAQSVFLAGSFSSFLETFANFTEYQRKLSDFELFFPFWPRITV
jgi:hypothetical protein